VIFFDGVLLKRQFLKRPHQVLVLRRYPYDHFDR
jgi:hypothetical protein